MAIIIYLLFLICIIIYLGKSAYTNYRQELPLGYGRNKIVDFIIILCILIGQYTIPSAVGRLIAILIFAFALLVIYAIIGLQNKKYHSGELFLFYQKEVSTATTRISIGIGLVVFTLFLICFVK